MLTLQKGIWPTTQWGCPGEYYVPSTPTSIPLGHLSMGIIDILIWPGWQAYSPSNAEAIFTLSKDH